MACLYMLILNLCCPVILNKTLDCAACDSQSGGLSAFAERGRREIILKDSSIRDLTWALIIS